MWPCPFEPYLDPLLVPDFQFPAARSIAYLTENLGLPQGFTIEMTTRSLSVTTRYQMSGVVRAEGNSTRANKTSDHGFV